MKYIIKITLLLILITYSELAVARNSNTAHTHTNTPIELGFVSSNSAPDFKLAAVCFLGAGDCGEGGFISKGDEDMGVDTGNQCQNEGYTYTASNCALPKFLEGQCVYNSAYYKECKQDIPRACSEAGYTLVSQCASGQKLKKTPRCQWDNNYGICCKETCPTNSSLTCTGASAGDDTCGYTCKKCCSDDCPKWTAKNYSGTASSKTECGNNCYKCKCPGNSSPSFTGTSAGSSECGTCYNCNTTCPRGQTNVSCGSKYRKVEVSKNACGSSCYECQYNTDCDERSTSCSNPYECSYNSCGICSSCRYNSACYDSPTSCSGKGYSCDYNSCGICSSCRYNYDCDATPRNCEYGCSSSNSCGICVTCAPKKTMLLKNIYIWSPCINNACHQTWIYKACCDEDNNCSGGKAGGYQGTGSTGYHTSPCKSYCGTTNYSDEGAGGC